MTSPHDTPRVVFLHVAKTAGTSLTRVLQQALPADRLVIRTHRPLATLPTADHAATVTVVREPLDRLVSAWSWLRRRPSVWWRGAVGNPDLVAELGLDRFADTADFLDHFDLFYEDQVRPFAANLSACDRRLGELMAYGHFNLFVPQHLYLVNTRGETAVGRTLRFSHLQDDVAAFLAEKAPGHGDIDWPHLYASQRRPAAEVASPRALAAVRDIYRADYALPGMDPAPAPAALDAPARQPVAGPSPLQRAVARLQLAVACPAVPDDDAPAVALIRLLQADTPTVATEVLPADRRDLGADDDPAAVLLAWAWEMRAELQDRAGDRQAAIVSLCRAVAAAPDQWQARVRLAGWRLEGGDRRIVLEELRRLKDLATTRPDPDFVQALAALAARAQENR